VPVAVVALAGALLLLCCIKRRRHNQHRQPKPPQHAAQQQRLLALVPKDSSGRGLRDIEAAQPPGGYQDVQDDRERDQVSSDARKLW
jgi:hypothetical protein